MKNAIILHGACDKEEYYSPEYPSASNFHWLPWLQKHLLINEIATTTPEISHSFEPDYSVWKREFERHDITPETILVGHSYGAGFILRWLSENSKTKIGKAVLVAPSLDPEERRSNDFFDFEMDSNLASRTKGVTIFSSTDDEESIQQSVKKILAKVENIKHVEFRDKGHFVVSSMGTDAFPELLEEVLGKQ